MASDFAESSAPELSGEPPKGAGDTKALLWVGAVALNLWLVAVAIPGLRAQSESSIVEIAFAALTLFGVGVAAYSARERRSALLLVAFPTLTFVHLAAGFGAQDGFALIATSGAMAAYVATASVFGSRPSWRSVHVRTLGERPPGKEAARRAGLRRFVTALVAIASFVVGVVVPALGFDDASWNENARPAARALVAVMSGLVATLMLAAFAGPAARRRRRGSSTAERRSRRVGMLLTVAIFGAFLAFVISR
ncbi:MAG: hypothetical protein AB8H86_09505 [Polyangiales bacterium]